MAQLYFFIISTTLVLLCVNAGINRYVIDDTCPENQVYRQCGSMCTPYCNVKINDIGRCDSLCYPGCYCMPGYIRKAVDSKKCIPKGDCKNMPECGENQIYKECEKQCPRSCANMDDKKCDGTCFTGCVCKLGYVRLYNSVESGCVSESKCPANVLVKKIKSV